MSLFDNNGERVTQNKCTLNKQTLWRCIVSFVFLVDNENKATSVVYNNQKIKVGDAHFFPNTVSMTSQQH